MIGISACRGYKTWSLSLTPKANVAIFIKKKKRKKERKDSSNRCNWTCKLNLHTQILGTVTINTVKDSHEIIQGCTYKAAPIESLKMRLHFFRIYLTVHSTLKNLNKTLSLSIVKKKYEVPTWLCLPPNRGGEEVFLQVMCLQSV
jgi:hypothetical protein